MHKLALMFVSLFFLIGTPATAAGPSQDKWLVTQLSGDARVLHPGLQPASAKVNTQLTPGDTLLTGPTGRATLVRGADYIVVAPRSELRLPSAPQPTGFTRVIQNLGTLLFKVQHTGIPHFAVDTPMLAAVVKGTTFTVVVDQQRSAVQVIQGAVQVTATDGGMSRIVEGGRTVFVNYAQPKVLMDTERPPPAALAPSATSVSVSASGDAPLATIATLTGGLVRADLSSPQAAATTVPTVQTALASTASSQPAPQPAVVTVPGTAAGTTASTPPATTPSVTVPSTTTPTVAAPGASAGSVSTPIVTVPSVTVSTTTVSAPPVTAPSTTTPVVTVPSVSVGSVSTPTVTVPSITTSAVTVPSVTTPTVTVPSVTTPTVTIPTVTTPTVTVPSVTTPVLPVTTPTVTVPPVSIPTITVPVLKL